MTACGAGTGLRTTRSRAFVATRPRPPAYVFEPSFVREQLQETRDRVLQELPSHIANELIDHSGASGRWPRRSVAARFWEKVDKDAANGCWEWRGATNFGYGSFCFYKTKMVRAHRFAYELMVGEIPDGLTLDHLCRNRGCVNPAHLEAVTSGENVLRGFGPTARNATATHCKHGHSFDDVNTGTRKTGRYCRECARQRQARRRQMQKAAA